MKKKLIGLSTLLLVLLLGLFTTSYAMTETEYKNVCYNYLVNKLNYTETNAKNTVDGYDLTNVRPYFENNDYGFYCFIMANTSQELYLSIVKSNVYNSNDTNSIWWGNSQYHSWSVGRNVRYKYNKINTNGTYDSTLTDMWSQSYNSNIYGTELDVWGTTSPYDSTKKIYVAAGTWNSTISKEGPYVDDYFVYSYNPDLTDLQVPNIYSPNELTTIKSMTYNDFVGEYVAIVGMLKYLDYIQVTQAYWDNSISDWKLYRNIEKYITNNDFESTDPIEVNCPRGWWKGNTIIKFTAYPTWGNTVGDILEFWVYLVDNNTVVNNGVLQIGSFSGDYNNNIQNDLNNQLADDRTQEVINTITDDSQVDNILNEFTSGDYNTLAVKFGFVIFSQEYFDFISDTITDIVNVLEDDEDVYFDYSMHGETPTRIYASDFTTPPGVLKTFLSTFLVACTVYAFYKYMADLLELLSTGNIETALQEFKVDRNIFKM